MEKEKKQKSSHFYVYVSAELSIIERDTRTEGDFTVNGTAYRLLTTAYYGYLFELVSIALKNPAMPDWKKQDLKLKWEKIHGIFSTFPNQKKRKAEIKLAKESNFFSTYYLPRTKVQNTERPVITKKEKPFSFFPNKESQEKVGAVQSTALNLGWKLTQLQSTESRFRFPVGHDWGLICFLQEKSVTVKKVTEKKIILSDGTAFYNHEKMWNHPSTT